MGGWCLENTVARLQYKDSVEDVRIQTEDLGLEGLGVCLEAMMECTGQKGWIFKMLTSEWYRFVMCGRLRRQGVL
jgi:hypothetical protein